MSDDLTSSSLTEESWTPVQGESAIKECTRRNFFATQEYRKSGVALIDAKAAYIRARTRALFDVDCPRPSRAESITVGDRDAWVDRATENEKLALEAAEVLRENAIEALRTTRKELDAAMALNASAREAYKAYTG